MAYQKRNKGPRYATTGSIIKPGQTVGLKTAADLYKQYLKGLMTTLQNKARQAIFRSRPYLGRCAICEDAETTWFYVSYDSPPQVMAMCHTHHKEYSQLRGSIYDQLVKHGVEVISWEEWKNGKRVDKTVKPAVVRD